MPHTPLAIAIDVGGTTAKLALVSGGGRLLSIQVIPTGRMARPRALVGTLAEGVAGLRDAARRRRGSIIGIAVGVPGLVDGPRGMVRYLVNMPRWRQVPLRRLLTQRTGLPTVVENDVTAMTWGEFQWGAGRGARSLACLMLGTGVGGGLVADGRLYRGWTMSAGEIGHVPLGWDGPRCPCGGRACLERYVGSEAIVALARRKLAGRRRSLLQRERRRLTPERISQAARAGDAVAREIWREVGRHLGLALTMIANVFNPERIVIGGGVAQAGAYLLPTVRAIVRARAMRGPAGVPIIPARFGADAGLVGAAALLFAPPQPSTRRTS